MINKSKKLFVWLLAIFGTFLYISNGFNSSAPFTFSGVQMTIPYRILIGHSLSLSQKQQIESVIEATFAEINQIYNPWNPHSEISQLNALPAQQSISLSKNLMIFFQRLDYFVQLTEGRFDPTIAPLKELWIAKLEQGSLPSQLDLEALKPALGWDKIEWQQGFFSKKDDRTCIDVGGAAKGLCVDFLIERLQKIGLKNLLVDWGGELRAVGRHPEGRFWHIYISHFQTNHPDHALAFLHLNNQALATSGDYFQQWTIKNEEQHTFCHIFNPLTYQPLEVKKGSIGSASVLANDCFTADCLAKTFMFFNTKEELERWAKKITTHVPELNYWVAFRESDNTVR